MCLLFLINKLRAQGTAGLDPYHANKASAEINNKFYFTFSIIVNHLKQLQEITNIEAQWADNLSE